MTASSPSRLTDRRGLLAIVAALSLITVAAAGYYLGRNRTDAAWYDHSLVKGGVQTGAPCTGDTLDIRPLRDDDSEWDEVGLLRILAIPEACTGLTLTVQPRNDAGQSIGAGVHSVALDAAATGPDAVLSVTLNQDVSRSAYDHAFVTIGGWPIRTALYAPIVAVGYQGIWTSYDQGTTWTQVADATDLPNHTLNSVTTDGKGTWFAVGFTHNPVTRNQPGGPVMWTADDDAVANWERVTLPVNSTVPHHDFGPGNPRNSYPLHTVNLSAVATDGDGTWVATGGAQATGPIYTTTVWWSTDNGATWTPDVSDRVDGEATLFGLATDGTHWVASGSSWGGMGTIWNTPQAAGPARQTWACATSSINHDRYFLDWDQYAGDDAWDSDSGAHTSQRPYPVCPSTGPRANAQAIATNGAGTWIAAGSYYGRNPADANAPMDNPTYGQGIWRARTTDPGGLDYAKWTGSTPSGGPHAPVDTRWEYARGIAAGPDGHWVAVGHLGAADIGNTGFRIWQTSNDGDTWARAHGSDASGEAWAVATDQKGLWLVGGSTIWRATATRSGPSGPWALPTTPGDWSTATVPVVTGPTFIQGIAFDQSLPRAPRP